jgi:hypothetical protein
MLDAQHQLLVTGLARALDGLGVRSATLLMVWGCALRTLLD